jgi:hypothetical protein
VARFLANAYVASILSNVLTIVILAAPGAMWYLVSYRRRFLTFFGLRKTRRVVVYTSRIDVPYGSSVGVDGRRRTFAGITTPDYEARLIADINAFFGNLALPFLRWRAAPLLRWADIEVRTLVSPISADEIRRDGTIITIGSPAYNVVSGSAEDEFGAPVRFVKDNNEMATRTGTPVGVATNGAIQRIVDGTTGQVVFYLAGPSITGTTAAVRCLLRDWRQLAKRHRSGGFFAVVQATSKGGDYLVVADAGQVSRGQK